MGSAAAIGSNSSCGRQRQYAGLLTSTSAPPARQALTRHDAKHNGKGQRLLCTAREAAGSGGAGGCAQSARTCCSGMLLGFQTSGGPVGSSLKDIELPLPRLCGDGFTLTHRLRHG